jgi:hypothetical protein
LYAYAQDSLGNVDGFVERIDDESCRVICKASLMNSKLSFRIFPYSAVSVYMKNVEDYDKLLFKKAQEASPVRFPVSGSLSQQVNAKAPNGHHPQSEFSSSTATLPASSAAIPVDTEGGLSAKSSLASSSYIDPLLGMPRLQSVIGLYGLGIKDDDDEEDSIGNDLPLHPPPPVSKKTLDSVTLPLVMTNKRSRTPVNDDTYSVNEVGEFCLNPDGEFNTASCFVEKDLVIDESIVSMIDVGSIINFLYNLDFPY